MSQSDLERELETLKSQLMESESRLAAEFRENRLLRGISQSRDLDDLLDLMGEQIAGVEGVCGYFINLIDADRDSLVCEKLKLPGEFSGVEETYRHLRFPVDSDDPNAHCYREGRSLILDQQALGAEAVASTTSVRFERWRMTALAIIPISASTHCMGTIAVFRAEGGFQPDTVERVEAVVPLFTRPIGNALYHRNLRQKEDELNAAIAAQNQFLRFIAQVNSLTSTESIYDMIAREFLGRFPFDLVGVLTRTDDQIALRRVTAGSERYRPVEERLTKYFNDRPYELSEADGASPLVYLKDSPLYFQDATTIMDLPMSDKDRGSLEIMETPRTIFILPIRRNREPIGVLWLVSLAEIVPLGDGDRDFVELLCSFIGTAMANAELYTMVGTQKAEIEQLNHELQRKVDELRRLVSRDPLTGLANFRAFEAELDRRRAEYDRQDNRKWLSIVMFDVDHFKRFNDTYGHLTGNLVLQEVAQRLVGAARAMDVVCRYGGEEFVAILPRCTLEGASIFAERARAAMADMPVELGDSGVVVTVSAGCTTYRAGESSQSLVARADHALYAAKRGGRNRVECEG